MTVHHVTVRIEVPDDCERFHRLEEAKQLLNKLISIGYYDAVQEEEADDFTTQATKTSIRVVGEN